MSCYYAKVKNKKTDEVLQVFFIDDYYGRHRYGIWIKDKILTEEQFEKEWETVE